MEIYHRRREAQSQSLLCIVASLLKHLEEDDIGQRLQVFSEDDKDRRNAYKCRSDNINSEYVLNLQKYWRRNTEE